MFVHWDLISTVWKGSRPVFCVLCSFRSCDFGRLRSSDWCYVEFPLGLSLDQAIACRRTQQRRISCTVVRSIRNSGVTVAEAFVKQ